MKVKELILRERSSEEFENEVRRFLVEKQKCSQSSANSVADAEKHLRDRQGAFARGAKVLAAVMSVDAAPVGGDEVLTEQFSRLRRQVAIAESNLKRARKHAESGERAFENLSSLIHETRNIGEAWERLGEVERRSIFDHWVLAVYIAVAPIEGMRRANRKTAVVVLRTDPYAPRHFEVPRSYVTMGPSAARSSATTDGSDSMPSLASSAAADTAPPSLPSAQAACERTSGSSSPRAAARGAAASMDPLLLTPPPRCARTRAAWCV